MPEVLRAAGSHDIVQQALEVLTLDRTPAALEGGFSLADSLHAKLADIIRHAGAPALVRGGARSACICVREHATPRICLYSCPRAASKHALDRIIWMRGGRNDGVRQQRQKSYCGPDKHLLHAHLTATPLDKDTWSTRKMPRTGFEPVSPPRKGGMIGRTTPTGRCGLRD